jgi:hypothetical protein
MVDRELIADAWDGEVRRQHATMAVRPSPPGQVPAMTSFSRQETDPGKEVEHRR